MIDPRPSSIIIGGEVPRSTRQVGAAICKFQLNELSGRTIGDRLGNAMKTASNTITKKDLVDRIADQTSAKRVLVKRIVQSFLDEIVSELGEGNRLEFRDFGVFEIRSRAARMAQNPKTMEKVFVPPKRTVKFKIGRLMKQRLFDDNQDPAPTKPAIHRPQAETAGGAH